jgi:hypothetical protein
MRKLAFTDEQLASMPEAIRAQVQTPEFAAMVKKQRSTGRRESRRAPIRFTAADEWWMRKELERRGTWRDNLAT